MKPLVVSLMFEFTTTFPDALTLFANAMFEVYVMSPKHAPPPQLSVQLVADKLPTKAKHSKRNNNPL